MARGARGKSESGYYHVILRGINKQDIFFDDEDRKVFINRFKIMKETVKFDLVCFCLMTNHIHLLIKEEDDIGKVMSKVLASYVIWYNSKYERVGHLFQNRYKSETIETDEYLLQCARYILQNPVKANICNNIWEYKWSSAKLLLREHNSIISDDILKDILEDDIIDFMEQKSDEEFLEWEINVKYTDEKMFVLIENAVKSYDIAFADISRLTGKKREEVLKMIMSIKGANAAQVSRITGISYHYIRSL